MQNLQFQLPLIGLLPAAGGGGGHAFFFSTGDPDGLMATATRPDSAGKFEIESADDFVLTHSTSITSATFTGLLPAGGDVSKCRRRDLPRVSQRLGCRTN